MSVDSATAARRIGMLTTDERLVVTSWDASLAAKTGVAADQPVGRPLDALIPDLDARGLLPIVRDTLATGAPTILAPAFHKYFIPAPTAAPSPRYAQMQQRVALAALVEHERRVGLVITIEDVTERL